MPQVDRCWDVETDLLVVGAGAAGMTAALVAALEGLSVVLCEKSDMVGGTTATSAGTVWIPGNRQGLRAGTPDTVEAARTYLAAMLGEHATDQRLDIFLKAGPIVLDYLEQKTSVRFAAPAVHPDYKNLPGAAIGGRALGTIPFDGRKLGDDFARVRPPRREFMILGGMMVGKADIPPLLAPFRNWTNFRHVVGLLIRHALDRVSHNRGTRLIMGNALVARLLDSVRRAGVELRFETALREIICEGDDIVGAVLSSPTGEVAIRARRGVVLATGGVGWSRELRERLFPGAARRFSLAPSSNTGDGILAAERVNAVIERDLDSPALWMPSSVMAQADGHLSVFPHIMLDRAKPGLLAVNTSGRRFVNEADSYHDFVAAMLRSNASATSATPAFPDLRSGLHQGFWHRARSSRDHEAERLRGGQIFDGGRNHRSTGPEDGRGWRPACSDDRAIQSLCRNRGRRRLRPRLQRIEPVQWRSSEHAEPVSTADRSRTVLRCRRMAFRPCQQRRLAHGFMRPSLVSRWEDTVRPLRSRHRFILDLPRHLPGARNNDRPGYRTWLVRRDGCSRNVTQVSRSATPERAAVVVSGWI